MQWIFLLGGIIYYLYKAYQQEAQKNVNKPLTPVNKPVRQGPKRTTAKPQPEVKSLDDIWKELKKATQDEEDPEVLAPKPMQQMPVKKTITSNQYETMFNRGSILDEIPADEGGTKMSEVTPQNADYEEKTAAKKFIRLNGKMLTPKDSFLATIIWEKKF